MSENDRLQTFNFEPLDEYFQEEHYAKASQFSSLKELDYWMSKITNNKSYSDNFVQEEYRNMYPQFSSSFLLETSTTVDTTNGAGKSSQTLISSSSRNTEPHQLVSSIGSLECIISEILMYDEYEDLLKVLAFYMVQSDLADLHIPLINQHIEHFVSYKDLKLSELNHYLGDVNYREIRKIFLLIIENQLIGD